LNAPRNHSRNDSH
jgi:hypothetical protein